MFLLSFASTNAIKSETSVPNLFFFSFFSSFSDKPTKFSLSSILYFLIFSRFFWNFRISDKSSEDDMWLTMYSHFPIISSSSFIGFINGFGAASRLFFLYSVEITFSSESSLISLNFCQTITFFGLIFKAVFSNFIDFLYSSEVAEMGEDTA